MSTAIESMRSIERISEMLEAAGQWLALCKARRLHGDMLREAGEPQRALAMYNRAMDAYRRIGPNADAGEEAYLLDRFTALHLDENRFREALPSIARALEIRESTLGADHEETSMTRHLLKIARQQSELFGPGSNVVPFRRRGAR